MSSVQLPTNDDLGQGRQSADTSHSRQHTLSQAANFIFGNGRGKETRSIPWSNPTDLPHTTNSMVARREETYTPTEIELLKHLAGDFGNLLNRADISDCFLRVRGVYMAVHRCVLAARSNTFAAVISGNVNRLDDDDRDQITTSTEKEKLVIVIDKTDPEIMKQAVIFMYTARCTVHEQNAYDLLDAAGRYDIKSLKVYAAQVLIKHITLNNILQLLEGAYKYNNSLLKQHCIAFFLKHSKQIMDIHQPWKAFADHHPQIVTELFYWNVHPQDFAATNPPSQDSNPQW